MIVGLIPLSSINKKKKGERIRDVYARDPLYLERGEKKKEEGRKREVAVRANFAL